MSISRENSLLIPFIIDRLGEIHGIELNCFAILGLPGDTIEGSEYTAEINWELVSYITELKSNYKI